MGDIISLDFKTMGRYVKRWKVLTVEFPIDFRFSVAIQHVLYIALMEESCCCLGDESLGIVVLYSYQETWSSFLPNSALLDNINIIC